MRKVNLNCIYKDEATLLAKVKEWLEPQERHGIKLIRINDRIAHGYSDLFINAKGRFVVAELKDDIGVPTIHQEIFIEEMQRCGAIGGICRSVQDVKDLIEEALYCTCLIGFDDNKKHLYTYCPYCGKLLKDD